MAPSTPTPTSPTSTAAAQLAPLASALTQLKSGDLTIPAFASLASAQTALLAALPPRFEAVLMQLLTRLESGAAFSEESCSFSQHELLDSLTVWVDKAGLQLQQA
ncbi:MAG: hypothetical protein Q7T70_14785 [Polaromonas sp.]|nr:hypothetical protein [Polaromonas sp.]